MEGFTLVDGGAALILLISGVLAYSRGLVRELLSIAGWVIAAIVAFLFAPQVEPLIREIPIVSDIIGTSCELSIIAAFAVVFAVTLIIVAIFTPLFSGWIQRSALSGFDQGLGFLFGIARGALLLIVALFIYNLVLGGGEGMEMVENSKTKEILSGSQSQVEDLVEQNEARDWFLGRYAELTTGCGGAPVAPETVDGASDN